MDRENRKKLSTTPIPAHQVGGSASDLARSLAAIPRWRWARSDAFSARCQLLDWTPDDSVFLTGLEVFPDRKDELAKAWSELQYSLRDRLQEASAEDLGGRSFFSVVIFEPDGRIAWIFHRGLDPNEEQIFCGVVQDLAEDYRFPLRSDTGFSQCGTTHFAKK